MTRVRESSSISSNQNSGTRVKRQVQTFHISLAVTVLMDAREKKKTDQEFRQIGSGNSRGVRSRSPQTLWYSYRRIVGRHHVPEYREE